MLTERSKTWKSRVLYISFHMKFYTRQDEVLVLESPRGGQCRETGMSVGFWRTQNVLFPGVGAGHMCMFTL